MVRVVMGRAAFRPLVVLAVLASVPTACVDSGLPGENLPVEDARMRPPVYNTYDASLNVQPVHFDDRDWMAAGPVTPISATLLTAITGADHEVFALATDSPPYTRLYLRTGTGFTPLAPAPGQGTAPAADAVEHH